MVYREHMKKKLTKNIVISFCGQLFVLILGIIIPRVLIINYGSDINGLISTVTQIFTYMALLEAGIGQAARNALFKPIIENDKKEISYVASVARNYFRKLTLIYGLGVLILSITVPFILKSNVDKITICLIVLFQGFAGVISFYFIETQTIILNADGRGYVNNGINVINQIVSYVARIVLAFAGVNVALLQFTYLLITIAKVFVYRGYFKKNYGWIDYKIAPKKEKLKDRNAYVITELAWTIFSSTDMIVISTFIGTKVSSVYALYKMVFSSLNVLLNAVYISVAYILGQSFHEDKQKYEELHDIFTSTFLGIMTVLMSVSYVMILPFVRLYTNGVNDVRYIYKELPLIFCLIQIISWSRYVTGNLTAIAGYAKNTGRISLIEAMTNVVLSVVLVKRFGIIGVGVATVVALPLKVVYCAYLSDKKILKRSCKKTISILGANYLLFSFFVVGSNLININIVTFVDFIKFGIIFTLIASLFGVIVNLIANRDCKKILRIIIGKK